MRVMSTTELRVLRSSRAEVMRDWVTAGRIRQRNCPRRVSDQPPAGSHFSFRAKTIISSRPTQKEGMEMATREVVRTTWSPRRSLWTPAK